MSHIRLYADFNNADSKGRIRLNGAGTLKDLAKLGLRLQDGLMITVHDEELTADGEAIYSELESVWTVKIDWNHVETQTTGLHELAG